MQTKKGAYSWWMQSSARVHGQQARHKRKCSFRLPPWPPTLAQGPARVPQRGGPEDELELLEFHPEKLRRWREKRMLFGSLVSGISLDTGDKFGLILSN